MNGSVAGGGVSEEVIRLTRGPSGEAGAAALCVGPPGSGAAPRRGGGSGLAPQQPLPWLGSGGTRSRRRGCRRGAEGSLELCGSSVLSSPGRAARRWSCAGAPAPSALLRKGTASCVSKRELRRTWSSAVTERRNAVCFSAGSKSAFSTSVALVPARLLVLSGEATGVLPFSAVGRPELGAFLQLVGSGTP